jgi:hypothetical protein
VRKAEAYALSLDDPDHPGAMARTEGFEHWAAQNTALKPSLIALPNDWAGLDSGVCRISKHNKELEVCATQTTDPPTKRVVIVGDSHLQQYIAALRPIAEDRNWQISVMLKGACPFSTTADAMPGDKGCIDWNAAAAQEIIDMRPDMVFTLATRNVRVGLTEETPAGFLAQWRAMKEAEIPVFAIRDNPRYDYSPSICANTYGAEAPQCSVQRAEILAPQPPYAHITDLPPNVSFLDFSDYFCTEDLCPPAIGNVLIYIDNNHLTATYMTTMSPIVAKAIDSAQPPQDPH